MEEVIYTGLFLSEREKNEVILKFENYIYQWEMSQRSHSKLYADHITTAFKPSSDDPVLIHSIENKGMLVYAKVEAIGWSDKAIALKVSIDSISCNNKIPHLTLATSIKNNGKPVDSNNITNWTKLESPYYILTQIGYYTKSGVKV